MLTAATILYGNYPKLAVKVLGTLKNLPCDSVLIGLNSIGTETRYLVDQYMKFADNFKAKTIFLVEEENKANVGKYPLMRRMLELIPTDIQSPNYIMWFDDDSYIPSEVNTDIWLQHVMTEMNGATQIGALHRIRQRNKQYLMIRQQPWYTGKPVDEKHAYLFATGGWWVADFDFLSKWNYPFPDLYHNGGDSILGELIRQQEGTLKPFSRLHCCCESCRKKSNGVLNRVGVVINEGGRAGRRGLGVTDEYYIWSSGTTTQTQSKHNFKIEKVKDVKSRSSHG